jgi:hypothetical protein
MESGEIVVRVDRALAIAARARIRRRVPSDAAAAQNDSIGAKASSEQRDTRGRFVRGHAGGPGRPPRDCLREAFAADLFLVWRRHGKQAAPTLPGGAQLLSADHDEPRREQDSSFARVIPEASSQLDTRSVEPTPRAKAKATVLPRHRPPAAVARGSVQNLPYLP